MTSAMLADLAALIAPEAEVAYRRQLAREAARDAYARGYRDGFERGARLLDAEWPAIVAPIVTNRPDHGELERRRLHVCCRACRRAGQHRQGCTTCEDRDRETVGKPHPGDYPGRLT